MIVPAPGTPDRSTGARAPGTAQQAESLIEVLTGLAALLGEETAAVRARDYRRLETLSEQKGRLAEAYGRQVRMLAPPRGERPEFDSRLGARLRAGARELVTLLETNARTLSAAKTAHERLIKAIGDSVAARARPATGYSHSGGYARRAQAGGAQGVPIALNQTV